MTSLPKISAVIFDMDGLMLDTEPIARTAWLQALADWGYQIDEADYLHVIGTTLPDTKRVFYELLGEALPFAAIRERQQEYVAQQIKQQGIPTKSGLWPLLDWLEQRGMAKAVASSTERRLMLQKLTLTGLQHRFTTLVGGDEVMNGKPAPDIFLEAARRLTVPADRCLVFEDSEPGIRAAQTAGMLPVMIPDLKPPSEAVKQLAFEIFPSLIEARQFLKQVIHQSA